jgi:hypothetical protein
VRYSSCATCVRDLGTATRIARQRVLAALARRAAEAN